VNPPLAEASVQGAACEVIGPLLGGDAAPASVDVPAITAVLVPGEGGAGPFGSRDMGGAPGAAAAAALLNAVARASGGRIEALPASPERVLGALDDARSAAAPSAD
jgi:CO/xanthine dehydrogenase Mo-binding subunit